MSLPCLKRPVYRGLRGVTGIWEGHFENASFWQSRSYGSPSTKLRFAVDQVTLCRPACATLKGSMSHFEGHKVGHRR